MGCNLKHRIARWLAAGLFLSCAALGLVFSSAQEAQAYSYLTSNTTSIFNRSWISAESSGYLELIGSDPIGPRLWMPSWQNPGGEYAYISNYQFAVWGDRNGQDDLVWYSAWNGSWSRGGANMGTGDLTGSKNGTGFGCIATYGYGWGGTVIAKHGGLDALMHNHVYITASGSDGSSNGYKYAEIDFWPRVKIRYDANGGAGAPGAHYKYIGSTANVSSVKPTRTGYTFEGWSTKRAGPVNIASGQKIGYQDWNLRVASLFGHGWDNGPSNFYRDTGGGQPSPTGTNVIALYAQWKPITYTVSYSGNGATRGSTAASSHIYDATKTLPANGFQREYRLTCDAQGGSAGTATLTCAWPWKSWNTRADGAGASYGNRASVKNLRSTKGTTTLYAQWTAGKVVLPSPGTKQNSTFEGWYTDPARGTLLGRAGDSVSIAADTACYARWRSFAPIGYYVDGDSDAVFEETVSAGTAYRLNDQATRAATKADCAGFDGWYADAACTERYVEGTAVPAEGLRLYGRNCVTVSYDLTDRSRKLLAAHALFADEALSESLPDGVPLPPSQTCYYGDRIAFSRGASVWFEERDRAREASCEAGAYATAAGEGTPARVARITANTVAYLDWRTPAYDGIAVS